jgi:hypothetical protein
MHHRYSEPVKKWSHSASPSPSHHWPEKGTVEYYAELADRDRFLRGRRLSQFDAGLAFSDGNSTFRISSLGLYVTISFFLFIIKNPIFITFNQPEPFKNPFYFLKNSSTITMC